MRTTKALTITLPAEMARAVKERVTSGAYASESEVVRDGLRALMARERAVETWLSTEGVARYDALVRAPHDTRSAEDAAARLRDHIASRRHSGG